MQFMQDSIQQVAAEKDSNITSFISVMNEIQMNLDSIRQVQEMVKMQTNSGAELNKDARTNILDDIKVLHELLVKNKELVAKLQTDLNSSKNKIGGLQKTIMYLNQQVELKNKEIAELNDQLANLHLDVQGLKNRVSEYELEDAKKADLIEERNKTIEQQVLDLNTGHYVFGTFKELMEHGVVEKDGGLLGIGRTIKLLEDFNKDVFTTVDTRELKEINLNAKKLRIITPHPSDSYEMVTENDTESLKIADAQRFWETTKYLVIVVN